MNDKSKVLHGLSSCGTDYGIPNICEITECPYREYKAWCVHELAHDAGVLITELLKVQEPVKPKMVEFVDEGLTWEKYEIPTCGVCGTLLGDSLFCPQCGRPVKWE